MPFQSMVTIKMTHATKIIYAGEQIYHEYCTYVFHIYALVVEAIPLDSVCAEQKIAHTTESMRHGGPFLAIH